MRLFYRSRLRDVPNATEQLRGLVIKGAKITHQSTQHDDHATAIAAVVAQLLNQDWSGSRGYFELTGQTQGGALFADYWRTQDGDCPTPMEKQWAPGSVEHGLWIRGEIGRQHDGDF